MLFHPPPIPSHRGTTLRYVSGATRWLRIRCHTSPRARPQRQTSHVACRLRSSRLPPPSHAESSLRDRRCTQRNSRAYAHQSISSCLRKIEVAFFLLFLFRQCKMWNTPARRSNVFARKKVLRLFVPHNCLDNLFARFRYYGLEHQINRRKFSD